MSENKHRSRSLCELEWCAGSSSLLLQPRVDQSRHVPGLTQQSPLNLGSNPPVRVPSVAVTSPQHGQRVLC
jgi:hypothetical protein